MEKTRCCIRSSHENPVLGISSRQKITFKLSLGMENVFKALEHEKWSVMATLFTGPIVTC